MAHNPEEINAERLFKLLESLSKFVDKKIRMYALGGTALTILKLKKSTLDIDLNIASETEYVYLLKIFEQVGFEKKGSIRWMSQEGMVFDIFHGSHILGTNLLSDCLKKSKFIKAFGLIELYTLSLEDIIISKLARGDTRDFDDIKSILEHEKIDIPKLASRYRETMEDSVISQYKQKFLDLIEIKFGEWGFSIDEKLLTEVKEWN
ncbi:MAG: DUF6036 family nucleotidyltransferase [Nanoarchaeota archaeon]